MSPLNKQRVLIFVPLHNSKGKKDVTGAFLPEAKKFVALAGKGSRIERFDNSKNLIARRSEVLQKMQLAKKQGFTSIAFFCHGWSNGIQAGFLRNHVALLAESIEEVVRRSDVAAYEETVTVLFCCSTGDDPQDGPTASGTGDNSFADKTRDALCGVGIVNCRVVGHTTVAHTTMNPMVIFMDGMGVPSGGVGGYHPVKPGSADWARWKKALRTTDLRLRMPYMTPAEIHEELEP